MVVLEPGGQRPVPHHMPHGEIHQYDKKTDGCDQTPLQNRSLMIRQSFLGGRGRRGCFVRRSFYGSAIARLFHSGDDLLGRSGSLHAHGVGQKADGTGSNSRNMGNGFFHPGAAGCAAHPGYCILFHKNPSLFHQFLQGGNKLVDGFIFAFADVPRHAGADMACQQFLIECVHSRVHSCGLYQDIVAVGVVLQHTDDPADLSFHPFQAVDKFAAFFLGAHGFFLTAWTDIFIFHKQFSLDFKI